MEPQTTSLKDPGAEYANRPSPLKHHMEHPTALAADCRYFGNCAPRDGVDICKRPQDLAKKNMLIGQGPSLAGVHNAHYSGGFTNADRNELVVAAYFGGSSEKQGVVVSIDLRSGDRRVVSGAFRNAAGAIEHVGDGPPFHHVVDVRAGPDGQYYAFSEPKEPSSHEIIRVDPETGNRELVWKSRDPRFAQLLASDGKTMVQTHGTGFAVDESDGSFLLGITNPQTGTGIIRVSPHGDACVPVSVTSRDAALARGNGEALRGFVQGYTLHKGCIYAFTTQPKHFLEIDPVTGDRSVLVVGKAAGAIGERWAVWDNTHAVWWTAGLQNSVTLVAFDPATKKTLHASKDGGSKDFPWFPLGGSGPFRINSLNYGGIWMHPTEPDRILLAHDSVSIVEFEISTGNSIIRSL
ncbi:hypothetical protein QOT17_004251 [Balamuthia mandrillaris]